MPWWYHWADSGLAPSQWETSLQSNAISHWLGANPESALSHMVSSNPVLFLHMVSLGHNELIKFSLSLCHTFDKVCINILLPSIFFLNHHVFKTIHTVHKCDVNKNFMTTFSCLFYHIYVCYEMAFACEFEIWLFIIYCHYHNILNSKYLDKGSEGVNHGLRRHRWSDHCCGAYQACWGACQACGRAYQACGGAYQPCGGACQACGRAYQPCVRAYQPCERAYQPCGRAYQPCGRAYQPCVCVWGGGGLCLPEFETFYLEVPGGSSHLELVGCRVFLHFPGLFDQRFDRVTLLLWQVIRNT